MNFLLFGSLRARYYSCNQFLESSQQIRPFLLTIKIVEERISWRDYLVEKEKIFFVVWENLWKRVPWMFDGHRRCLECFIVGRLVER